MSRNKYDDSILSPDDADQMSYAARLWGVSVEQIMEAMEKTETGSRNTIYGFLLGSGAISVNNK